MSLNKENKVMKKVTRLSDNESIEMPLEYLVSSLNQYYELYINNVLRQYNVTRSQTNLLLYLSKNDKVTQEYLSKLLNVQEGTITKSIMILEKKELVYREIDSKDRRKRIVNITEKGKEIAENYRSFNKRLEEEIKEELTNEEIKNLKINMKKLTKIISAKNMKN